MATKKKIKKQKVSECCGGRMIGGVQCEVCGSNGKFTTGTAIIKRLDTIIKFLKPEITHTAKAPEQAVGERFIDNGDGTISDTKNRLMWSKEGSKKRMEHKETEEFCKNFNVGGYNDWCMPTVEELRELVDYTRREPAINPGFKCELAGYWTSTPYVSTFAYPYGYAWCVYFSDGYVTYFNRYYAFYVRPVRQY